MKKTLMILAFGLFLGTMGTTIAMVNETSEVAPIECKDGDDKKACCKKDGEKKSCDTPKEGETVKPCCKAKQDKASNEEAKSAEVSKVKSCADKKGDEKKACCSSKK